MFHDIDARKFGVYIRHGQEFDSVNGNPPQDSEPRLKGVFYE